MFENSPGYTGSVNDCKDNNSYHEKSEEDGNSDEDIGKDDHSDDNLLMVPPGLQLWYDDLLGVVDTLLTWASQCFMCQCVKFVSQYEAVLGMG